MLHTRAIKDLVRLLQLARRKIFEQQGLPLPISKTELLMSRRQFLQTTGAVGAGLLVSGLPGGSKLLQAADSEFKTRIAIIGAGLAGLNAAYQLQKAGLRAELFEANDRLGGRVWSRSDVVGDGLTVEMGGELINTDHADMLDLVQEFGLTLFNRRDDAATVSVVGSAYYISGKSWSEAELVPLMQPLVDQISQDAQLIDDDWDTYAPKFDKHSVKDYLDQYAALIPDPVVRTLFENAIRTEYGVEAVESSALQLLFLLPSIDGQALELLGYSDETYTVQGGNSQIIAGLANALGDQIHTGHELISIASDDKDEVELRFANGVKVEADVVIVAIPFTVLRKVDIKANIPGKLKQFINTVNLGRNEKVLAGFTDRVWRTNGFSLEAWTDLGFSEAWDGSQRQSNRPDGVLNYFLGGNEVDALNNGHGGVNAAGAEFTQRLSRYVANLDSAASGKYARSNWTRNRYSRGAYVNFAPGQLTHFGDYFWIESDIPDEQQSVSAGRLVFAGEHISDEYYGFMNGGAQTGRLAAQFVLQKLASKTKSA